MHHPWYFRITTNVTNNLFRVDFDIGDLILNGVGDFRGDMNSFHASMPIGFLLA
jgi:hypothetical protein